MRYNPWPYQEFTTQWIIEKPFAGPLLDMGLGKTVSTLTAIDLLMNDLLEVSKVLVIAPLRVASFVWPAEIQKWDHLRHLTISKVLGTERQRKEALKAKADIYVINRENVPWLIAFLGGAWPFDMIVVDESSSFKSAKSARFKALRQVLPKIKRAVNLTGTPIPNGLIDLWPQMYILDRGQRLGKTLSSYRETYFLPGRRKGHVIYDYKLKTESDDSLLGKDIYEKEIYDKISDICFSMKAEDHLNLPERLDQTVEIRLPAEIQKQYDEFERNQILALGDIDKLSAPTKAALWNKLLQFANGAVYKTDSKEFYEVHSEKLEALAEMVEALNGKPLFVFYAYQHDSIRIQKHLKAFKPRLLKSDDDITDWNDGKVSLMLAHPQSAGHGLNLQAGGHHVTWFSLPWSLEQYRQGVTRFHRQGQQHVVINQRMLAVNTLDETVLDALDGKAQLEDAFMHYIKAKLASYEN